MTHKITRSQDHKITRSQDHKITRSQDHKITRSQDHKITSARVFIFVVMGLLAVSLLGCGVITDASGKSVSEFATSDFSNTPSQCVIDAGIVFADEAKYLCVPLTQLGIADSDEVLSVNTSCECTHVSIVQFGKSSTTTARALRIDFRSETATSDSKQALSNLAVKVTLQLSNGHTAVATIQFLHAVKEKEGN